MFVAFIDIQLFLLNKFNFYFLRVLFSKENLIQVTVIVITLLVRRVYSCRQTKELRLLRDEYIRRSQLTDQLDSNVILFQGSETTRDRIRGLAKARACVRVRVRAHRVASSVQQRNTTIKLLAEGSNGR